MQQIPISLTDERKPGTYPEKPIQRMHSARKTDDPAPPDYGPPFNSGKTDERRPQPLEPDRGQISSLFAKSLAKLQALERHRAQFGSRREHAADKSRIQSGIPKHSKAPDLPIG